MAKAKRAKSILDLEKKTFTLMEVSKELGELLDVSTMAAYQRIYRAMYNPNYIDFDKFDKGLKKHFGEYRLTRKLTEDILNGQIN